MFLHAGASLHGHEYSNRASSPPAHAGHRRRSQTPLLRSALAPPKSRATAPGRLVSEPLAHTSEPIVRFREPADGVVGAAAAAQYDEDSEADTSYYAQMSDDDVSFSASESDISRTTTTKRSSRRRRIPRKSTTFLLAHPAPKLGVKKHLIRHIRPQLILQIQQLSEGRRPQPAIDVFPSSLIAGPMIAPRFAKRFPRVFGVKGELGLHDVILVRYNDWTLKDSDSDPDERDPDEVENLDQRALVAVLSPLKREDRAEIVLEDGTVWTAAPWGNGSYEFTHVNEMGDRTAARWVRRAVVKASAPSEPPSPVGAGPSSQTGAAAPDPEIRFTFSIINPLSRRHPVMATLTPSTLDVLEDYTTVSTSSGRYPPTKMIPRSYVGSPPPSVSPGPTASSPTTFSISPDQEAAFRLSQAIPSSPTVERDRTTYPVDKATKMVIGVTAIWVALRQGWSPYYKIPASSEITSPALPSCVSPASSSSSQRQAKRHSDLPAQVRHEVQGSRRSQSLEPSERPHAVSGGPHMFSRRPTSTGAAYMQRRAQMQASDGSDPDSAKRRAAAASSSLSSSSSSQRGVRVLRGDWHIGHQQQQQQHHHHHRASAGVVQSTAEALEPAEITPGTSVENAHLGVRSMSLPLPRLVPAEVEGGGEAEAEAEGGRQRRAPRWRLFGPWFRKLRS